MRVFVTGASGYLGTALVTDLVAAGHEVAGLTSSPGGGARIAAAGGTAVMGDLQDAALLARTAADADAVAHLAWAAPGPGVDPPRVDLAAIRAIGDALAGSAKRFVVASGVLGLDPGVVVTETTTPSAATSPVAAARAANGQVALGYADRDVAAALVRLAPAVHDDGRIKPGFAGRLVEAARAAGSAGYPGDGAMRWSAVHRLDAARLFALAVEHATPGAVYDGVAEQGVTQREIAETIATGLGLTTVSLDDAQAAERFGWLAPMVLLDGPATSEATQRELSWHPSGPGLLDDLRDGAYFRAS